MKTRLLVLVVLSVCGCGKSKESVELPGDVPEVQSSETTTDNQAANDRTPSNDRPSPVVEVRLTEADTVPVWGDPLTMWEGNSFNKHDHERNLARMNSVPEDFLMTWLAAIKTATGDDRLGSKDAIGGTPGVAVAMLSVDDVLVDSNDMSEGALVMAMGMKMSLLFDGNTYNQERSNKYLKRLGSLCPAVVSEWQAAFQQCAEKDFNKHAVALILLPVDELFVADLYESKNGEGGIWGRSFISH